MRFVVTAPGGDERSLEGHAGDSVMLVSRAAGLPMLGECNGSMACATCHVIVEPIWAARLPPPSDSEEEALDTIFDLTATSRLGCQIRLTEALDGLRLALPSNP